MKANVKNVSCYISLGPSHHLTVFQSESSMIIKR